MSMTKNQIQVELHKMEKKLEETLESFSYNRGPANDALKIVVPMIKDQIKILKAMLELIQ